MTAIGSLEVSSIETGWGGIIIGSPVQPRRAEGHSDQAFAHGRRGPPPYHTDMPRDLESPRPYVRQGAYCPAGARWVTTAIVLTAVFIIDISVGSSNGNAQLERLRKPKSPESPAVVDTPMDVIPEGAFTMGFDGAQALEDERPAHRVWLDAFSIDRYEVSTAQYAVFLAAANRPAPWQWDSVRLAEHAAQPVIGVDWHDADAYCHSKRKRLPTEAEWEKAARGTDGRLYPWGNQAPTKELANFALGSRFSYSLVLLPVQSYEQGKSPYGVYQMAGNAYEWVQDWYGSNYYDTSAERNPQGPEEGQFKVLRGGSWSDLPKYLLTYGRFKLPPETRNSYAGFRCAKSS